MTVCSMEAFPGAEVAGDRPARGGTDAGLAFGYFHIRGQRFGDVAAGCQRPVLGR